MIVSSGGYFGNAVLTVNSKWTALLHHFPAPSWFPKASRTRLHTKLLPIILDKFGSVCHINIIIKCMKTYG